MVPTTARYRVNVFHNKVMKWLLKHVQKCNANIQFIYQICREKIQNVWAKKKIISYVRFFQNNYFWQLNTILPWLHNNSLSIWFQGYIIYLLVTTACCVEVIRLFGLPTSSNWVEDASPDSSSLEPEASLATTTQRMAATDMKAVAHKTNPASMGLDHGQKFDH